MLYIPGIISSLIFLGLLLLAKVKTSHQIEPKTAFSNDQISALKQPIIPKCNLWEIILGFILSTAILILHCSVIPLFSNFWIYWVLGWLGVLNAVYSCTFAFISEPNQYQSVSNIDRFSRAFHLLLLLIVAYFNIDLNISMIIICCLVPIWTLGLFPPITAGIPWILEQVCHCSF